MKDTSAASLRLAGAVALCLATSLLVATAIFQSRYGSVFFMDDDERYIIWLLPLLAGATLGLIQSVAFSIRAAAIATVALGVSMTFFLLMAGTLLLMTLGAAAGCAVAWIGMRRRRPVRTARSLLAVGTATGIVSLVAGWMTPGYDDLDRVQEVAGGPSILSHVEDRDYMSRHTVTGVLADVDGCLGLERTSPPSGPVVVLWPHGTVATSDPFAVTIDGTTYRLGDVVAVGGGLVPDLIAEDPFWAQTPSTCRDDRFWG